MSQLLQMLSQLLESKRAILTEDELANWPEEAKNFLVAQKVLVSARPATHVTCNACHDDHIEDVSRVQVGDSVVFRIPCPEAGWVEVSEERLRQWTFDVRRLVDLLSAAVGSGQWDELIHGLAWRLGIIEIAGGSCDLVFVRTGCPGGTDVLKALAGKHPASRTIIIGTRDGPNESPGFVAWLPLSSAFTFTQAGLTLRLDRIRSVVAAQTVVAGNVFQLRGEVWQLSYEGQTVFLKDSVGLGYIARLLAEPNRDIPAVTLLAARAGIDPLVASGSSGDVLDDEARDVYSRRYQDLMEGLAEAEKNNDLGKIEKLEGEQEMLMRELARATGLGGRSREKTDAEKVRKSVSMAVARDLERIGRHHEALGRHLDLAIDSGLTFRYSPERDPGWLT